jgi:hypothetical protein
MKLSKGEFCQFSLASRLALLDEFGKKVIEKRIDQIQVSIYRIYGFYVAVFSNALNHKMLKAEPVSSRRLRDFYLDDGSTLKMI